MTTTTRSFSWGDGLVVAAFKAPGGLKQAVDRIHEHVGPYIGVRNTFSKLLTVDDPGTLNPKDQLRAWLLITALGDRPEAWGIPDKVVPKVFDIEELRTVLPRLDSNQQPAGYPVRRKAGGRPGNGRPELGRRPPAGPGRAAA